MKHCLTILIAMGVALGLTSCATIFGGPKSKIVIGSNVAVADQVTVDKKTSYNVVFPYTTKVRNGYGKSTISAQTKGYQPISPIKVRKTFNVSYLGNILLGGIPGMTIDLLTGSVTKAKDRTFMLQFQPIEGYEAPKKEGETPQTQTTIINNYVVENKKEASDNTDNKLESTIIRWYVVSSPAGADVHWRVVSSTPNVKNTNQSFIGSTPYESTESFDVTGLTYENSGNVQIEISCEKPGYITQRRRFNVRQAIDQKEISTKFNLIKEE